MSLSMVGRDVFIRHTSTTGKKHVSAHRAWDAERFVFAQIAAATKVNLDAVKEDPKAPALAAAEQITHEQFNSERKA